MIHKILSKIKNKIFHLGMTNEERIAILIKGGAKIGKNLNMYGRVLFDLQYPFLIEIGNDVEITNNVQILTHDYSWSVVKKKFGILIGGVGPIKIGNNVFIGTGTTILMNTQVGDNCIVGAGSVLSGIYPKDCVIAGVPAKVICTIDDYFKKRQNKQYAEACEIVKCYRSRFGKEPSKEVLPAYFWLFEKRTTITSDVFIERMKLKGNYDLSFQNFLNSEPMFESYEDFLRSIK